ncbi:Swt1 family HEPN domain-containing protein [Treponema sp. HNW]|uniref:Swt1 family HEPN domain-containing protein n=1 Tax=Treponema sp. HNW TaxID=3116654 RepID=UPI003D12AB14
MNKKTIEQKIMAFGMSNTMVIADLKNIQDKFSIKLGIENNEKEEIKQSYYPQFREAIREDAKTMSQYYELFYCLEKSIREIVSQTIEASENTENWWTSKRIPDNIKNDVRQRIQREIDMGMTRRSEEELDYTTFGELSQIITTNWDIFGSLLSSKKALEKVMTALNNLRGPIAHCSMLAEDEVLRLKLTVRDWFRLME